MTVLQALENITSHQIDLIVNEYDAMPQEEFRAASLNARLAAATLRKPTWTMWAMAHTNALLLGLRKLKFQESYSVMKLLAAVEIYAHAIIGQAGISYTDYNLAIGSIASVLAPEQFADQQDWEIEKVKAGDHAIPYRPASYRNLVHRRAPHTYVPQAEKILSKAVSQALAVRRTEKRSPINSEALSDQSLLEIMGVKKSSS